MKSSGTLQNRVAYLLIGLHVIGAIGTLWPATRSITLSLTPLNLLISALALIWASEAPRNRLYFFFLISALLGFFVEVAGVKTGAIFGTYSYGDTLGLSVFNVPLVIGVNWFLLSYIFGDLVSKWTQSKYLRVLLAAFAMVAMDFVIEPIAMRFDYWQWEAGSIPIQNYVGWFAVSVVMQVFFLSGKFQKPNPMVVPILIGQLIYFGSLHLYHAFF